MTSSTTSNRITYLICNDIAPELQESELSNDSSLFDDLKLNSINIVELLTQLEGEFSIELDDEDMGFEHFATVGTLSNFINEVIQRQTT